MLAQRPRADRAFERVYRQNVRHVYGYALAVLHSPEDAEDVTQATFLNAYRAYERGEFPRSPDNWLISIAHGLCDQRARQESRLEAVAYEDQADEAVPEDEGPSQNDVRRALGRLPFDQRAALMMREVEGRSYAELVEILGVSSAEVESLLFRARRALREELDESSLDLPPGGAGDLQAPRRPARPRRAQTAAKPPSGVRRLRPFRPRPANAAHGSARARQRPAPGLTRVVLREVERISGQSVGFRAPPASPSARGRFGPVPPLRLESSSLHRTPLGGRRPAVCEGNPRRVPSGYESPEQAECRPRLGGVERDQGRGEAKAKSAAPGRSDGSMRPNKSAIAAALATVGGAVWFLRRRSRPTPTRADLRSLRRVRRGSNFPTSQSAQIFDARGLARAPGLP